jgi:uncharacterized protein (DUF433 family)
MERITVDPNQCGGRPCIRGLRIRVSDILDLLASGAKREEILEDYPYLENQDITAAPEYAAKQLDHSICTRCLNAPSGRRPASPARRIVNREQGEKLIEIKYYSRSTPPTAYPA